MWCKPQAENVFLQSESCALLLLPTCFKSQVFSLFSFSSLCRTFLIFTVTAKLVNVYRHISIFHTNYGQGANLSGSKENTRRFRVQQALCSWFHVATDSNLQQPEQRQEVPRGLMTGLCVTVGQLKESTESENIGRAVHRSDCKAQLTHLWMVTRDRCVFGLTKQNEGWWRWHVRWYDERLHALYGKITILNYILNATWSPVKRYK